MATNFRFDTAGTWITGTVTRWPMVSGDNLLVTIETARTESSPTVEQPNRTITVTEEFTTVIDSTMKDAVRDAVSAAGELYIEPGGMITIGYYGTLNDIKQWAVTYTAPTVPRTLLGTVLSGVKLARSFLGLGGS